MTGTYSVGYARSVGAASLGLWFDRLTIPRTMPSKVERQAGESRGSQRTREREMYNEKIMDHFKNPRNVGVIDGADGIGEVGNPVCGDVMTLYIKVKDGVIEDVKFETFGCGAAIAVSSMVSEMAKGKSIEEASTITNQMVAEALDGLPRQKMHCSNLGADALRKAIENYRNKHLGIPPKPVERKCYCPFCDVENPMESEYCTGCGKELAGQEDRGD